MEKERTSHSDNNSSSHPILGTMVGREVISLEQASIDSYEELRMLELKNEAANYLLEWFSPSELTPLEKALGPLNTNQHYVDRINNQFMKKIIPCLLIDDVEAARSSFRKIIPNTIDEEMVLLINDRQFEDLHLQLNNHIKDVDIKIETNIAENLDEIAKADRMQFSGNATRSLENMLDTGLVITIDPINSYQIVEAAQDAREGILPLTEYVKNGKILGVNGFMESKISLAVHDFMDHLWTFDMINKLGLLERYEYMFDSIGAPHLTDIYKREGEIVASIAFGVRYFHTMPSAFGPLMRSSQIESHLDELFVNGDLEERHLFAYRTLKSLRKGSIDWQSLGFSYSNYLTELDEQKRKYGKIKQVDPKSKKLIGELDPLSPDFICFFIDTHQQLLNSKNKHRDDLFRFHILLEEYLIAYAEGQIAQDEPFIVRPEELRLIDFSKTTLPPQRINWMRNNLGFTATRDAII